MKNQTKRELNKYSLQNYKNFKPFCLDDFEIIKDKSLADYNLSFFEKRKADYENRIKETKRLLKNVDNMEGNPSDVLAIYKRLKGEERALKEACVLAKKDCDRIAKNPNKEAVWMTGMIIT